MDAEALQVRGIVLELNCLDLLCKILAVFKIFYQVHQIMTFSILALKYGMCE